LEHDIKVTGLFVAELKLIATCTIRIYLDSINWT